MKKRSLVALTFFLFVSFIANAQIITTIAGDGTAGFGGDSGPATAAQLDNPRDIAFDVAGNIYVADSKNNRIRKVSTSGIISTIAGTGSGGYNGDGIQATDAQLNYPSSITFDAVGNLYITDDYNCRVRKISMSGIITTIAGTGTAGYSGDDGNATIAQINNCVGIAIDEVGNVFINDGSNYRIRKINNKGIITTIAGTGVSAYSGNGGAATASAISQCIGLAVDASGNVYFAEYNTSRVRQVNTSGIISTVAGKGSNGYSGDGGPATAATLYFPSGVSIDDLGNLYISEATNSVIRKVNITGIISTVAGTGNGGYSGDGGMATNAQIKSPGNAKVDKWGSLYIADWGNNRIRYVRNALAVDDMPTGGEILYLYPNPCQGQFIVEFRSQTNDKLAIAIYDISGKNIGNISTFTNMATDLNIPMLPGIYLLIANTNSKVVCTQLVVSR